MECCATEAPRSGCPGCGTPGRRVRPITLDALVREGTPRNDEAYRFCPTSGCDVAWFGEATGHALLLHASRVRIGQKESAVDRPLCYCFGYCAADLSRDGALSVPDRIAERCRRGEHRCAETNPQGACCLGNVRAALNELLGHP